MNKTTLLLGLVVALTASANTLFAQKKVRKFDNRPCAYAWTLKFKVK